ncbi:unnamed protein product [Cunninghamella echinulata]
MVPIGLYFKVDKSTLISSTAPNNNNNNDLICHCYNMFQTLDMPDKLKYIQYLYQQQHYIPFLINFINFLMASNI